MREFMLRLMLAAGLALSLAGPAAAQPVAQRGGLPLPGADIEYVARDRDTMIDIARRYLNDGKLYEVQRALWEHNQLKDKNRISPGQVIRIPENWVRNDAGRIELAHVEGDVQSKGQPLQPGAAIAAGDDFRTGKNGYVTLKLADGSTLVLQPGSDMVIEAVRKSPLAAAPEAKFLLKSGRVEASVPKRANGSGRFEVRTPIAVVAVRGARFRVSSDSEKRAASSEVLEGAVQVDDAGSLGSVSVPDGLGTRVLEGSAPSAPRALLPAPRLWTGMRLWLKKPVRLNFTRLAGAVNYRVLVAREADFRNVITESVLATNEIELPELKNGPYFLRVRGIDDLGLEGRDAAADLVLNLAPGAAAGAPAPNLAPAPVPVPVPAPAGKSP